MLGTCPSKAPPGCLPAADHLPQQQGEERGRGVFSRAGQALTPCPVLLPGREQWP